MAQEGTQAIRRAVAILTRIARATDEAPATLSAIATSFDLPKSTVHRILKSLTDTGLATYDPKARRYGVGLLCYELGLAVTDEAFDISRLRVLPERLARRTGLTAYLMRRSGLEAVCLAKAEGSAVIRVMPVDVGQRRLLGAGAGATALLAELPDETVERVLASIDSELGQYANLSAEGIRQNVARARAAGYAVSAHQVYASTFGLGMCLPVAQGLPDFAVSLAAYGPDATPDRIEGWIAALREEVARFGSESA
ncbi:IclR family transcriptional regulator [Pseudooceanicola sp. 200-1SW]|uniref:IclR family transcriptional regulator n=1 Tax=Pseudooceanicola sp. 200-1SW TaxID=3425949 RepID=UPI003D7F5681